MGTRTGIAALGTLAVALLLAACESTTAPVALAEGYFARSVDALDLPQVVQQTATTDLVLVGELVTVRPAESRLYRMLLLQYRDRQTGAVTHDSTWPVLSYRTERRGDVVVLTPLAPCPPFLTCAAPDTLRLSAAGARLRAADFGRRDIAYTASIDPFAPTKR